MFEKRKPIFKCGDATLPIEPDFRLMCRFAEGIRKKDIDEVQKVINEFFPMGVGECSAEDAIECVNTFYSAGFNGGMPPEKTDGKKAGTYEPVFDFAVDECYFYAAFLSEYGIDLNTAKIHWFDFCNLFKALPDDCKLKEIIGIRSVNISTLPKTEQKRYRKLKKMYALEKEKHYSTLEERDNAMLERLAKMRAVNAEVNGQ